MKKIVICTLFALLAGQAFSQNKEFLSLQMEAGYYYYPSLNSDEFYFNYGLSPLLFVNINKFKIGFGVSYTTKNYSYDYDVTVINHISKKFYDIGYLCVPILLSYNVYSNNSNRINILTGLSFDNIVKFKTTTTYNYDDYCHSVTDDILVKDLTGTNRGFSILFSVYYYRHLSDPLKIFVSPFVEYKILNEIEYHPRYDWSFPNNKFTLGLKLGLEFDFKKTKSNSTI